MSEEKKRINLLPICAVFNFLQVFVDGSLAINPALIESWEANSDGLVVITMQSGREFTLFADQAEELINATRRALETAMRQSERANGRIVVPEVMH